MLIKQLSMFSSCCTNTIIISTLSTESIERITSKCLPVCSQCHQGRSVCNARVAIQPLSRPLPSLTPFSISETLFDILLFFSCTSSSALLLLSTNSLNTRETSRIIYFLGCSSTKRETQILSRRLSK